MRAQLATFALLTTLVSFGAASTNHQSARGHHNRNPLIRRSAAIPTNWSKGNCTVDAVSPRLLTYSSNSVTNTPAQCIATCASLNFVYAGLQYGAECWCGNQLASDPTSGTGTVVADSDCNVPCAGDSTTNCGGSWRVQTYKYTAPPAPPPVPIPTTWTDAGCYSDDGGNRTLLYKTVLPNNTPANCIAYCQAKDYHVAGTQYGQECWCGDAIKTSTVGGLKLDTSKCDYACIGNSNSKCGGFFTLNIYKNKTPTPGPDNSRVFKIQDRSYGATFFDKWNFWDQADPVGGSVNYLSKSASMKAGLAYVQSNNIAVIKVDNSTVLPAGKFRNAVRMSSQRQYNSGLFIFDIAKMPFGCSTWPALWTVGPDWPNQGELDIVEGINKMNYNMYTLHTKATSNCTTDTFPPRKYETSSAGRTTNLGCGSSPTANSGCNFVEDDPASYGEGLNAAAGATFAMLWETTGIRIWRWPHAQVPADINALQPKPESWTKPVAAWASTTCDIKNEFKNQNIIIDISLCGSWAGDQYGNSGCPGTCASQLMNPKNYDNASWHIRSVTVYQ